MNWKCFFGHDYKEIGRHPVSTYFNNKNKLPSGHETNFLFRCLKCQDTYSKRINGYFEPINTNHDDDNDDDRDNPTPPTLSPDDYYDLLTKE